MSHAAVTTYRGPSGDHNDRAMQAVVELGERMAARRDGDPVVVGTPAPSFDGPWHDQLSAARPHLVAMATRLDKIFTPGATPWSAITRCAVELATLPVVAAHHPDLVVLWLDVHGDINVPDDSSTGYLGGMALSGPLGWWDSGLGDGLSPANAVLVGARDLDPGEGQHVAAGRIASVPAGDGMLDRLDEAIAGRPVFFHLDCDVLEPGVVATDYRVPGGLTLLQLHALCERVATHGIVGVEVGEYEGPAAASADELLDALDPLTR